MALRAPGMGSAALALVLCCAADAGAATPAEIQALQELPCPAYEVHGALSSSAEQRAAALQGEFEPLPGRPATLVPPVDWHQDPYDNRTWVFHLHGLYWAPSLLDSYADGGSQEALAKSRDLALDWIEQVPQGDDTYSPLAWNNKTVGDRAGRLAYLARAAACEGLLSAAQAGALIDSLREHGQFLQDAANHPPNNHGLFVDYGLALIAYQLPFLPEAPIWASLSEARFTELLREELAPRSGLFLEHSPGYQVLVTNLTSAMGRLQPDSELDPLAARMQAAAGWFVMPGNTLAPLGDSSPSGVPPDSWLSASGDATSGFLADFQAGLGVVKKRRNYLAVTAWFHRAAHRHGDDLGFHLRDGGRDIISDSGYFSYQPDGWNRFSRSARAHSVLTVDGRDFPLHGYLAYGSGLRAAGRGGGWFALQGVNPLLRRTGVSHRRLFLYRPGVGLVVVDRLRSRKRHVYTRHFQVAPGIRARRAAAGWRLRAPGFRGFVAHGARTDRRSAARGEEDPIAGWAFPAFLERVPRWTVAARTRAADADLVAAIGVRGRLGARLIRRSRTGLTLDVREPGGRVGLLRVERHGRRLVVSQR